MKQQGASYTEVWWINPAKAMLLLVIPGYILLFLTPTIFGRGAVRLTFRTYWTEEYFVLGLVFLVMAAFGAWLGGYIKPHPGKAIQQGAAIRLGYLDFLALCALFAYLVWFHRLVLRPWVVVEALLGHGGVWLARSQNPTIPGLTTLNQLGVAYVICYLDRLWGTKQGVSRRYHIYFWALLGVTVFRVYVWAERIALAEIVVPIALAYLIYKPGQPGTVRRVAMAFGPVFGILGLIGFFAITEFFRSWSAGYYLQYGSFTQFIVQRLTSYYYTSLNNGAGTLTVGEWPTYKFTSLMTWLYDFPLLVGPIARFTMGVQWRGGPLSFLERYADPEFNNPSGIFWVFADVGVAGAIVYAALWGALAGYFYHMFRMGRGLGRMLFPLFYISILEIFKNLYLSSTRAFPIVVALLVGYAFFKELPVQQAQTIGHARRAAAHAAIRREPWSWNRLIRAFARR